MNDETTPTHPPTPFHRTKKQNASSRLRDAPARAIILQLYGRGSLDAVKITPESTRVHVSLGSTGGCAAHSIKAVQLFLLHSCFSFFLVLL